jgi:titin
MEGLTNGVTYYFAIAATNEAGMGQVSDFVSTVPYGQPGPIYGLVGTPSTEGISLTWSAPSDTGFSPTLSYRVLRGPTASQLSIIMDPVSSTTYLDEGVELGTTYFYSVIAYNPASLGTMAEAISVLMPDLPDAPFDLIVIASDNEVSMSWSPPVDDGGSPLRGYVVYRGVDIDEQVQIARINVAEYNDPGVTNGQTYYYHIRAFNIVGTGDPSVTVSTKPMPPPGAPSSLKVELEGDDVALSWDAPTEEGQTIIGYNVLRGTSLDQMNTIAKLGLVEQYTDKNVPTGRTYYYSVTAQGESSEGDSAEPVKMTIDDPWDWSALVIIILVVIVFVLVAAILMKGRKVEDISSEK